MVRFLRISFYWLPPIIWMTSIFYLSSRLRVTVTGKFLFDFLFFKMLHVIEYAILYLLLFRAFYSINNQKLTTDKKFLYAIFFSILYSISDEVHQTFVPTREGKISDIIIDSLGILLMYIYIKKHFKVVKKFL